MTQKEKEFYDKVNDFGRPRKQENTMNKDRTFNTSDSITFKLTETNSELYKEIKERAIEAKESLAEQGLEIVEIAPRPDLKSTTYIMIMNKETGEFHYYEDDSDD